MQLAANPLGMPIGCQTYPVRALIGQDFPGAIKQLVDAGFQTIELCSPVGYASSGFGVLAKYKGAELRKILGDLGVKCESSHFDMKELRENQAERIAWAKDMGMTQMLVPSLGGPRTPTMDDVKRIADEYNKMGELAAKSGIQQGLHNENFELTTIDGKRTYDILLELLDPKLVKFQFQISTISRGYDAAEYFTKYPPAVSFDARARLVDGDQDTDGGGPGQPRLEEDLYRRKNRRHQELLRRNEPGSDEGQRPLSPRSQSLRNRVPATDSARSPESGRARA